MRINKFVPILGAVSIVCGSLIGTVMVFAHDSSPTVLPNGEKVVQVNVHRDSRIPSQADMESAVKVVRQLNDAWNKEDWTTVQSLIYNTLPVPVPTNYFAMVAAKQGAAKSTFVIGKPYVIENWITPTRMFETDAASHIAQNYSMTFKEAVTVPVTFNDGPHSTLFHCVLDDNGNWKIAFSWMNGFELFDHPDDVFKILPPDTPDKHSYAH